MLPHIFIEPVFRSLTSLSGLFDTAKGRSRVADEPLVNTYEAEIELLRHTHSLVSRLWVISDQIGISKSEQLCGPVMCNFVADESEGLHDHMIHDVYSFAESDLVGLLR